MTDDKIKVLFEKCELDKANDKKLPSDSFVVSYNHEETLKYDIVRGSTFVDVFDAYYDKYKNVKSIEWTKGIVHPRTYDGANQGNTTQKEGKKKMNIDVNADEVKNIKKKYKKLQKYMRSSLYEIKIMDGNETKITNLLKENENVSDNT